MNKNIKKLTALLVTGIMIIGMTFSGCGSSGSGGGGGSTMDLLSTNCTIQLPW